MNTPLRRVEKGPGDTEGHRREPHKMGGVLVRTEGTAIMTVLGQHGVPVQGFSEAPKGSQGCALLREMAW
jgi:hypothetical protein